MKYSSKDLTIVICAYKECEFLEECIRSVLAQTMPVRVLISTSTPNEFISSLANKYNIEVRVNPDGGHAHDYNFALEQAQTPLCAMAHQDDLIAPDFVEKSLQTLNRAKNPLLCFTNYAEIREGKIVKSNTMLRVKRLLLWPAVLHLAENSVWQKRLLLRFGNPICHPTVTYVMDKLPEIRFQQQYKSDLDWDLWERMSRQKGSFAYCSKILLYHRMHKDQATATILENAAGHESARGREDVEMLRRFWPGWIVKLLIREYSKSENFYS